MGLLQGATELFPVSSLGHSVIIPSLLHWSINQKDDSFLVFLTATHLATSLVLFAFFYKDWAKIIMAVVKSLRTRYIDPADMYAKLGWLIIVGSIPAGILGLLLQTKLQTLFASPKAAAFFLICNGLLLYGAELLRKRSRAKAAMAEGHEADAISDARIAKTLTWNRSIKIGFAQAIALLPGFSRTGATMAGGLLVGLSREDAARFSFLLATPIIFAAASLKLPDLALGSAGAIGGQILAGAIASAIAAYFSVRYLTRYFKTETLEPFAYYCLIAGLFSLTILSVFTLS